MVGDVNADVEDIPILMHLVEDIGWVDCGAKAEETHRCWLSYKVQILVFGILYLVLPSK